MRKQPIRFLKRNGSKWEIGPWIASMVPQTDIYVEPFCGSAAVYFNLPFKPKRAILNDLDGDIVNLFRVIRNRHEELCRLLYYTPYSREELLNSMPRSEDELERARQFLVNSWMTLRQDQGRDGVKSFETRTHDFVWPILPKRVSLIADQLRSGTVIEQRDALLLIQEYINENVCLYVDPPYVRPDGARGYYENEMDSKKHAELLALLVGHPGPVLLSGYRSELYDDTLTGWKIFEKNGYANAGNKGGVSRTECLWMNPVAMSYQQKPVSLLENVA